MNKVMISVKNLAFSYTSKPFLEDIEFDVGEGEIFGFLGPSGAGKSTLQKVLTGLLTGYTGSAVVNGVESRLHDNRFYEDIGVDFEFPSLYEKLTARQNLDFFSSLYSSRMRKPEELLEMVGLIGHADKKVKEFSKGMKSRLNFIKALLHDPKILFLDEPTSGLDPSNSRDMKNIILEEKAKGKTVILTTHNMQDATELCDRVAFIVDGKVKALDTPHNLIMSRGATKLKYTYTTGKDQLLSRVGSSDERSSSQSADGSASSGKAAPAAIGQEAYGECVLSESGNDRLLVKLISEGKLLSIHSTEPTLNDIFIDVTGKSLH